MLGPEGESTIDEKLNSHIPPLPDIFSYVLLTTAPEWTQNI